MGPGLAIIGALAALSAPAPAHCPAGVPVQQITVVNQAGVRPFALAKVERAVSDQSMQLRAAWGTPCVTWGPGGWKVYLKVGGVPHGEHGFHGQPFALVWTGGGTPDAWSRDFSHEIAEALVDPGADRAVWLDGVSHVVEAADPVQWNGYPLDGVYVTDFVFPAWFAGAITGGYTCQGSECTFPGPAIAAAVATGPYDEMRLLSGPWQAGYRP